MCGRGGRLKLERLCLELRGRRSSNSGFGALRLIDDCIASGFGWDVVHHSY